MKDIASYKPRYPNTSAVRKHIVEQFDLFDKDERHKFKWLRMKAHGLGDIKNRLTFDLACEADNEERFELETPRKAKQAKRSLDTDADTEGLPAKKSKPTDNGSINEPTEELTNNTIMDRFLGDDSIIPEKGADSVNATNSVYSNSNSNSNFGKACCHRGSIACGPRNTQPTSMACIQCIPACTRRINKTCRWHRRARRWHRRARRQYRQARTWRLRQYRQACT
jgi:hypothetical protein